MIWKNTTFVWATPARSGPQITVSADGKTATCDIFMSGVPSAVHQAAIDFVGLCTIDRLTAAVPFYSRSIPYHLPSFIRPVFEDSIPYLWCSGFRVIENYKSIGHEVSPNGFAQPSFYRARCQLSFTGFRYRIREDTDPAVWGTGNYSTLPDEGTLNRYVTIFPRPRPRVITAPPGSMTPIPVTGEKSNAPWVFGIPIPENVIEFDIVHHQLPELPYHVLDLCANGAVNSTVFLGRQPGTLKAEVTDSTPGQQADGTDCWDVTIRMTYNPKFARTATNGATVGTTAYGHNALLLTRFNTVLNKQILDYRTMTSDGAASGVKMLREVDFLELFRPAP